MSMVQKCIFKNIFVPYIYLLLATSIYCNWNVIIEYEIVTYNKNCNESFFATLLIVCWIS